MSMSDRLHISHQFWPGQIARGLFTGLLTGLAISLYAEVIFLVTDVNKMNPWLIIAIPFGAVLTQYLFKFFGERYRTSTASAIDDINHHKDAHKNWAQSQVPDNITPAAARREPESRSALPAHPSSRSARPASTTCSAASTTTGATTT